MAKKTIALAVLVKTATLSPVKTRLAMDIGERHAILIYRESLRLTAGIMQAAIDNHDNLSAYWAVGEANGVDHPDWQQFPAFWTGEGDFGMRLYRVYEKMRRRHDRVILMGIDSPQLTSSGIDMAVLSSATRVIGPASDGGFYLFASDEKIKEKQWLKVRYSCSYTLSDLLTQLGSGKTFFLPTLTDIDDKISLLTALKQWHPEDTRDITVLRRLCESVL